MPTHGDFIVRGLAAADRQRWDDWLSREMLEARAGAGEDFEDRYDSAPVWRFCLPHGDAWMAGALAPSCDEVGRRFPIVAGLCGNVGEQAAEQCEVRIYEGFERSWTVDDLFDALGATQVGASAATCEERWWTPGNEEFSDVVLKGEHPEGLVRMMIMAGEMWGRA